MEIQKISVENFYSYDYVSVSLSKYPYATVIGPNGSGKSSLFIDAPLFALYGSNTVRTKLDDIVREGFDTAKVSFEFSIHGTDYRINRVYSIKGGHEIDFMHRNNGDWMPCCPDNASNREIEKEIVNVMGCTHSEFTLGAVMRQNESGRFTRERPSERIQSLSNLIGVEYLRDAYTESGRKIRDIENELEHKVERLNEIEGKVEEYKETKSKVKSLKDRLNELDEEVDIENLESDKKEKEEKLESVESDISDLKDIEIKFNRLLVDLKEKRSNLNSELNKLDKEKSEVKTSLEQLEEELSELPEESISDIESKLEDKKDKLSELQDKKEKHNKYSERLKKIKHKIESNENAIEDSISSTKSSIYDLEENDDYSFSVDELISEDKKLYEILSTHENRIDFIGFLGDNFDKFKEKYDKISEKIDVYKNCLHKHETIEDQIENKKLELNKKLSLIDERPDEYSIEHCESCGLLSDAIQAKKELQKSSDWELQNKLDNVIDKKESIENEFNISNLSELKSKKDYYEVFRLFKRVKAMVEQLDSDVSNKSDHLDKIKDKRKELSEDIENINISDDIEDKIYHIKNKIDELSEDLSSLEKKDQIESDISNKKEKLSSLNDKLSDKEKSISKVQNKIEQKSEEFNEKFDEDTLDVLSDKKSKLKKDISELTDEIDDIRERNKKIREKRDNIQSKIDKLSGKLETFEGIKDKKESISEEVSELKDDKNTYKYARKFLKVAPNIFIGSIIPQIEQEANNILDDIAPEFQVFIRRQKETKSGSKTDKIHLTIRSGQYDRPYNNLSGGQKFRIDIAIRLALARVTMSSSGKEPLQTLILDEGWGSQDDQGKKALKDTLIQLKDRFSQIYVITHINDVRELFDHTIQINNPSPDKNRISIY